MMQRSFDLLVVGAGPAGLAAAARAARSGADIAIIDDNPTTGGQIWRGGERSSTTGESRQWLECVRAAVNVTVLQQTRVVAPLNHNALIAETNSDAIHLRYERLVLATGAREHFLPFPGWTLPGVMGAGGLQALVKGGLPIAGKRVVVAGSGPLLLAVAAYLRDKGAQVLLIAEQTPWTRLIPFALHLMRDPRKIAQTAAFGRSLRSVAFRPDCWVTASHGTDRLEAVTLRSRGKTWIEPCDYLACGYGLVPNTELPAALGCVIAGDGVQADTWQRTSIDGVYAAGETTGIGGLELALLEGQIAGLAATNRYEDARRYFAKREHARRFAALLQHTFRLRPELTTLARADTIVCRCEDVPYGELQQHGSWRSAKLQTRCGMGPCQGRVCGAATRFLFGWTRDSIRSPVTVARLASLTQLDSGSINAQEVIP